MTAVDPYRSVSKSRRKTFMKSARKKNLELSKAAFEAIEGLLPESSAEDVRGLIYDYNEWGLGVEMIVDVLLDNDIAITVSQKKVILDALNAMRLHVGQHELRVSS